MMACSGKKKKKCKQIYTVRPHEIRAKKGCK